MIPDGRKMPPQKQEAQPGKEHAMEPNPQFSDPDFKPSNKLQGKVVLVAGGDSGIGRSVCHYFAQEGATVAFTYVKGQEDKDACEMLEMIKQVKTSDAKDPITVAADLDFDENYKRIVEEVVKAYNCIDILVNNAAEQYKTGSVQDIDEARIGRVFRTYIFASFFMARHALKHMKELKEGSNIICTASVVAYKREIPSCLITQQPMAPLWLL